MDTGDHWNQERLTAEDIFRSLIKSWGFKKVKRVPDDFKKQFLREVEDEYNIVCYTLSGGPMVIFTNTGEFQEWA